MSEGYSLPRRLDTDPESLQRDLMKLVLTIIELVRQLMERQAIRRVDEGDLSDAQVEDLGLGLMRLEEAMNQLQEQFDLTADDLNLDLGPLGTLLETERHNENQEGKWLRGMTCGPRCVDALMEKVEYGSVSVDDDARLDRGAAHARGAAEVRRVAAAAGSASDNYPSIPMIARLKRLA